MSKSNIMKPVQGSLAELTSFSQVTLQNGSHGSVQNCVLTNVGNLLRENKRRKQGGSPEIYMSTNMCHEYERRATISQPQSGHFRVSIGPFSRGHVWKSLEAAQ